MLHALPLPMPRSADETIATNKRALHDYEVIETLEAGIRLLGSEVKAIRKGHVNLRGSYVVPRRVSVPKTKRRAVTVVDVLHVVNMQVNSYGPAGPLAHDPLRARELLLSRKETDHLLVALQEKGRTAVPLDLHVAHGLLKLKIALVRGKQLHDKRRVLREREVKRTIERAVRTR